MEKYKFHLKCNNKAPIYKEKIYNKENIQSDATKIISQHDFSLIPCFAINFGEWEHDFFNYILETFQEARYYINYIEKGDTLTCKANPTFAVINFSFDDIKKCINYFHKECKNTNNAIVFINISSNKPEDDINQIQQLDQHICFSPLETGENVITNSDNNIHSAIIKLIETISNELENGPKQTVRELDSVAKYFKKIFKDDLNQDIQLNDIIEKYLNNNSNIIFENQKVIIKKNISSRINND
ncbi:MAG: hypothetical protein IJX77_07040 [Ruminococcus sp.]|nr:hypothetical protein [Ruminococcus sp.]